MLISKCRKEGLIPQKGEDLDQTLTSLGTARVDNFNFELNINYQKQEVPV